MRRARKGALVLGLTMSLAGCAGGGVDPGDAAAGMASGAIWGAALGTSIGATFAINPAIGATMGAATGAAFGIASGILGAQQAVSYAPIDPAMASGMPGFYDAWAPGSHPPPAGAMAPPPRAGNQG